MTMFAIFRVSRGLNGLGDFEPLLFPERGVPILDDSWVKDQQHAHHQMCRAYFVVEFVLLAGEVIVSIFSYEDATTKVVECSVFSTIQYSAC